ncbi:hypothetical protein [Bowmanella denitrificans]|uniref:hypothetical protein n=1 Tax=Bowmanella denitrificans TaxID=366582 RepID=UPI000C9A86E9|nr:hypothetical protein [Bowmanella denitrificans]
MMSVNTLSKAEQENLLLKKNAILCLVLGLFFVIDSTHELGGWELSGRWALLYLPVLLLFFYMLYLLLNVSKFSRGVAKRAFWTGRFEDEYAEYLNARGYKFGYGVGFIGLITFSLFADLILADETTALISMELWAQLAAASMLIGYALPVIYGLAKDNE